MRFLDEGGEQLDFRRFLTAFDLFQSIARVQSFEEIDDEDTVEVGLLDVQNKRTVMVSVDREDKKYSGIDSERGQEV